MSSTIGGGANMSMNFDNKTVLSKDVSGLDKHLNAVVSGLLDKESNEENLSFYSAMEEEIQQGARGSAGDCQSFELFNFNETETRLKLRELERALLEDEEEEDSFFADEIMGMGECSVTTCTESSFSEDSSYISGQAQALLSRGNTKQMLIYSARALAEGRVEEASAMINELRQVVSVNGDPLQRASAYMTEGLAARVEASGKCLYKALRCKEPPSSERLAAMQILFEVCPCFKFGFMAANGTIIKAFEGESRVHIIDFDINQGSQYMTLLQTVAGLSEAARPHLRLTGVDDPESVQRIVGGLEIIGLRLQELADILGVSFEFKAVPAKASSVTPTMLDRRPGEALIVNFAFQLHHLPDESVSTTNQRDKLLRMVKGMNPKLVTMAEQDVNTNTAPFFPRFIEAYNYYTAVYKSLDVTMPRGSQDRMNVERHCLARDIVNIIACEGEERVERYEVAGKWRARMTMAGFTSCPMNPGMIDVIKKMIKEQYCDKYKVKEELGSLHFGWEDKSLIIASAWT
ncbi:PREDICTED: scarecrow-like protein 1 isoform X2 [Tarenaya hassleriana]|nr:PREDICTED: scarecrow-like protein 1 isoform X2 [Tarenaya hassleriana]